MQMLTLINVASGGPISSLMIFIATNALLVATFNQAGNVHNSPTKRCNLYESMLNHKMTSANAQYALSRIEAVVRGKESCLLLDLVRAAEHFVNVGKVVSTREEAIGLAGGGIALLQVGFLAKVAHLQ